MFLGEVLRTAVRSLARPVTLPWEVVTCPQFAQPLEACQPDSLD
jgi:hypothetical protein